MKYLCTFRGRLSGALGITYTHTAVVNAERREGALLALYERDGDRPAYEHISNFHTQIIQEDGRP